MRAYEDIIALAQKHKIKILDSEQFSYFAKWQNAVVREIAPHAPIGTKTSNIARQVMPEISAAEVGAALRYLERSGMLKKQEDGSYKQTDKILSPGDPDITSIALKSFHKKMAEFGLNAIENIPMEERNVSEVVVGITRENYKQIVDEIKIFRKRILAIATYSDDMERVYCMQTNLFPLSHKICKRTKKNSHEK